MSFVSFLSVILDHKTVDLIKIIEFQSKEIVVLKAMYKESRKPNDKEKRILGTLAYEIRHILRLGKLETIFKPETILKWYRQFANAKFDGSKNRKKNGRPETEDSTVKLIIKMATENEAMMAKFSWLDQPEGRVQGCTKQNKTWGADRIVGALKNLGIKISDQTVLNILEKNGIPIAPDRKKEKTWNEFIKVHVDQLWACDFLLVPVWTIFGLKHFHVFVFIQYCTRQIKIVGVRENPDGDWMAQIAKNITVEFEPMLPNCKYLVHDRDPLYTEKFENTLKEFGITPIKTPPRSPNLNPFAERVIRSIKYECLNNMIIFGEKRLRWFLKQYTDHYHFERNHQGIENEIIESDNETLKHSKMSKNTIVKKERLGGLLNYYYRKSA